MNANELASLLTERITASLADESKRQHRQYHPRASSIGQCAREVYYQITAWDKRPPPPAELQARFAVGRLFEREVIRDILALGFEVIGGQTPFEITEKYDGVEIVTCTGHFDGRLSYDGSPGVIFECKSLNGFAYDRIDSLHDFTRMGSFWQRYPKQLLVYLYAYAEPEGMYILRALDGRTKCVPVRLEEHLDLCEQALRTCRAASIGVIEGVPPDFYHDPALCLECWARDAGVCAPPMDFEGAGIKILPEALAGEMSLKLDRASQLQADADLFEELTDSVKATMKALPDGEYIAGDWFVKSKDQVRKNSTARITRWSRITTPTTTVTSNGTA